MKNIQQKKRKSVKHKCRMCQITRSYQIKTLLPTYNLHYIFWILENFQVFKNFRPFSGIFGAFKIEPENGGC